VRAIESKSSCDAILVSEFFFESGNTDTATAGSRVGDGFRAIWADAAVHNKNSNKQAENKRLKHER
jgi:hypothetical protein